jgi:hypothetical protein
VEILQLHALRSSLHSLLCITHYQLTLFLACNIQVPTTENSSPIVVEACLSRLCITTVAVYRVTAHQRGTCLLSCCPETALVYPPISWSFHSNGSKSYDIHRYGSVRYRMSYLWLGFTAIKISKQLRQCYNVILDSYISKNYIFFITSLFFIEGGRNILKLYLQTTLTNTSREACHRKVNKNYILYQCN